jgi:5'-3' exonuclease
VEKQKNFSKSLAKCNKEFKKSVKKSLTAIDKQDKDLVQFYCPNVQIDNSWNLPYPSNYSSEYDKAIKMLELSVYDTVTVTKQEFNSYGE